MNELTKPIRQAVVDAYLLNFDPADIGRVVFGKDTDNEIAVINGLEILKDRKINEEIDAAILKRKVQPDALKVEAYKLARKDSDGRVKVEALKTLGKWLKMEDPMQLNMLNLTWQQMVEVAKNNERAEKIKELPIGT